MQSNLNIPGHWFYRNGEIDMSFVLLRRGRAGFHKEFDAMLEAVFAKLAHPIFTNPQFVTLAQSTFLSPTAMAYAERIMNVVEFKHGVERAAGCVVKNGDYYGYLHLSVPDDMTATTLDFVFIDLSYSLERNLYTINVNDEMRAIELQNADFAEYAKALVSSD